MFGKQLELSSLNLILPVGISFYTFRALSYSIDVFCKKVEPTRAFLSFYAFVIFFPFLLAGPIERPLNMLPQFLKKRTFDYSLAVDGMRQILWGLFKKVVIADSCMITVNAIFAGNPANLNGSTLLIGAFTFAIQIYCDFSGYSDMAIGVAKLFGFKALQNFKYPYFSRNIAEFWRRWHISLTTWFRDYLYIPLGGSRVVKWKVIRNTFIIFLVSGLWHGANWTFITWGGLHALLFMPLLLLSKNRKFVGPIAEGHCFPSGVEFFQMLKTFLVVTFAWIFFRADTISGAFQYISGIFSASLFAVPEMGMGMGVLFNVFPFILVMFVMEWLHRESEHGLDIKWIRSVFIRRASYVILSLFVFSYFQFAEKGDFIYFQF